MCNFETDPGRAPYDAPVAVYHAHPHGLKDGLGQPVASDAYVNVAQVMARKRDMLACHTSQKEWLDVSQGMDAYLNEMERISTEVGRVSGRFTHAEGWRLHSTLGFGPEGFNPMRELLKEDYDGTTAE
jgi:LmbE family N-acetylglucosaminyl deacetylase